MKKLNYIQNKDKYMKEKIEKFLQEKKTLIEELKKWVVNKSIPLEERWELFIKSELGDHETSYWDFNTFDNEKFHDGEYRQKYQTLIPEDVINWATSKFNKINATEEQINNFKEEVLKNFIKSWEFDW
jgi:coenzyme F420-reducing hydrogenase alpha subunit